MSEQMVNVKNIKNTEQMIEDLVAKSFSPDALKKQEDKVMAEMMEETMRPRVGVSIQDFEKTVRRDMELVRHPTLSQMIEFKHQMEHQMPEKIMVQNSPIS